MPVQRANPQQVLALVRFVRDTDWRHRVRPRLMSMFGPAAVSHAMRAGYITQQVWHGERTDFVDLTPSGERYLVRMAHSKKGNV